MNAFGFLFTSLMAILVIVLPRRWVVFPFLTGAVYLPALQEIEIGPVHFPVIRVLIVAGILRALMKGEGIIGGIKSLDKLMILWVFWFACSSVFHIGSVFMTRLGEIFTDAGVYFLFRIFLQNMEDIQYVFKTICINLVPLAVALLLEKANGTDYFGLIFGGGTESLIRDGHVRAQGPFEHPILAGTVGAVCFPMALYLWRHERRLALIGMAATASIVIASASSGPLLTLFSILGAMSIWKIRNRLRAICWSIVLLLVVLNFIMSDPVYFLVARIDLAGGSTGWYRAQLIRSAIEHISDWWLAGTDYTRSWMWVVINERNTDITNYYIRMGVWGGVPLMLIFMGLLYLAFAAVGQSLRFSENAHFEQQFLIWTLGSILFGHAITFFSVSYFDQSVVFFFLLLAIIGSLGAAISKTLSAPTAAEDKQANDVQKAETHMAQHA